MKKKTSKYDYIISEIYMLVTLILMNLTLKLNNVCVIELVKSINRRKYIKKIFNYFYYKKEKEKNYYVILIKAMNLLINQN